MRHFLAGWTVLLLCWLINIALLGWGFNGINNYLSILNTVLSIVFLHKAITHQEKAGRYLLIAVPLGGLATFSFGNGILVWPIGLLMLYLCRAPRFYSGVFALAATVFFVLYFVLPGGDAVGIALHVNGWKTLAFPVTLMGGPAYHLLRAWRLLPETMLVSLSAGVGVLVCLSALLALWQCWQRREKNDVLDAAAITLILTGFGTVALLLLTRLEGVLDPTVDRFQIWAILVWLGVSVLLYRRVSVASRKYWQLFFLVFPVLALPSQLDWGARLAEYRMRVDNALLAYQVYLPVAADAERALHWNWQGKLPHLFPVLENLRATQRNVFADGAAAWLGKSLPAVGDMPVCHWSVVRTGLLHQADLLDVKSYPDAERYVVEERAVEAAFPAQVVGGYWYGQLDEKAWDYGLLADSAGIVRGLLYPVRASLLPRASGAMYGSGNAYGVARTDRAAQLMVLHSGEPVCVAALY